MKTRSWKQIFADLLEEPLIACTRCRELAFEVDGGRDPGSDCFICYDCVHGANIEDTRPERPE